MTSAQVQHMQDTESQSAHLKVFWYLQDLEECLQRALIELAELRGDAQRH